MHAKPTPGREYVGLAATPAGYRVRIWGAKPEPRMARALDEWDLTDVDDVRVACKWAVETAAGRDFEVFAVLTEPDDSLFVRVLGADGDADGGTSITIQFTAD
jgi:hypothetical protein